MPKLEVRVLLVLLSMMPLAACVRQSGPFPAPVQTPTQTPSVAPTPEPTPLPPTMLTPNQEPPSATPLVPSVENNSPADEEPSTLRQLAEKKPMLVGTYFNIDWFDDSAWQELVGKEFNLAMLSAGLLWSEIEPSLGKLDFSQGDDEVQFALSKKMTIISHLVTPTYSYGNPAWLVGAGLSRDELTDILRNHIVTVMNHYKGQIGLWMVVEEAYLESYTDRDFLYQKFGYDYLDLVYQIARETDPSATLSTTGMITTHRTVPLRTLQSK